MKVRLIAEPKNIYTLDDVFNKVKNAQALYLAGKFEEAYPIVVDVTKTFDFFSFYWINRR